jgi:hypothetical protein
MQSCHFEWKLFEISRPSVFGGLVPKDADVKCMRLCYLMVDALHCELPCSVLKHFTSLTAHVLKTSGFPEWYATANSA